MLKTSYYTEEELSQIGLKSYGVKVQLSRHVKIYGADKITLGNCVRIDDFCILSGDITIGSYVHIAAYCGLFGEIKMANYTAISAHSCLYARSDDYSGKYMTNPTLPSNLTNLHIAPIILEKHAIIGAGCIILPGVTLAEGTAIGAASLVRKSTEPFGIYVGNPAKRIKERHRNILSLELEHMMM